jgi:integrase
MKRKKDRKVLTFVDHNGDRRWLRFGRLNQREFEVIQFRVERLVSTKLAGDSPDRETVLWINGLADYVRDKLISAGLIEGRKSVALGEWLTTYAAKRTDVKESTQKVYGRCRKRLIQYFGEIEFELFEASDSPWQFLGNDRMKKHFGEERLGRLAGRTHSAILSEFSQRELRKFLGELKDLRTITKGAAADWRRWMLLRIPSDNTVRRQSGIAKQFFDAAKDHKLIEENPFDGLPCAVRENRERFYFVTTAEALAVIGACPDVDARLWFALARWGGLRVPSEPLELRWTDVDWERDRMTVRSPKTAHHEGKESRVVPIFPELRPYLQEAFEAAAEGAEFAIAKRREPNANLRTLFYKVVRRAGLTPWPKLFQNLRSTRETELAESFPLQAVTAWIGNSQPVAIKSYLQVTDEHYRQAVSGAPHKAPRQEPESTGRERKAALSKEAET